jgi:hypothetical protein
VTSQRPPKLPNWTLGLIFALATAVVGLAVIDAGVTRDPQNDLPDWAIGLIFVVGTMLLALAGFGLVHRLLPAWRDERSNQVLGGVAAMVMTMFAVLLAFVIVNLYNSYNGAVDNVAAEATSLTELLEDTDSFPPAERRRVERAVAQYVVEVRNREFQPFKTGGPIRALSSYSPTSMRRSRAFRRSRPHSRRFTAPRTTCCA